MNEIKIEVEKYGWWNGSVYLTNTQIDEETFAEYFDHSPFSTSLDIVNSILAKQDDADNTEVIAIKWLTESVQQEIKEQVMSGELCGTVSGDLNWELDITCTLDGEDISFSNLSDFSKEHILDNCIDGCVQGELCDDVTETYFVEVSFGEPDENNNRKGVCILIGPGESETRNEIPFDIEESRIVSFYNYDGEDCDDIAELLDFSEDECDDFLSDLADIIVTSYESLSLDDDDDADEDIDEDDMSEPDLRSSLWRNIASNEKDDPMRVAVDMGVLFGQEMFQLSLAMSQSTNKRSIVKRYACIQRLTDVCIDDEISMWAEEYCSSKTKKSVEKFFNQKLNHACEQAAKFTGYADIDELVDNMIGC